MAKKTLPKLSIRKPKAFAALRRGGQEVVVTRDYAEAILRTAPVPLVVLRADLRVDTVSKAFCDTFQAPAAATEGRLLFEIGNRQWDIPKLRELLEEIIPGDKTFESFEVTHEFESIGRRTMLLNARRIDGAAGPTERILLAIEDITERKQTEALLACQKQALEMAASGTPLMEVLEFFAGRIEGLSRRDVRVAIHLLDKAGTHFVQTAAPHLPPAYHRATNGVAVDPAVGPCCAAILRRETVLIADVAAGGEFAGFTAFALPLEIRAAWSAPIFSSTGHPLGTVAAYYGEAHTQDQLLAEVATRTASIIIERQRAEETLRVSEERFRGMVESSHDCIKELDLAGRLLSINRTGQCLLEIDDLNTCLNAPWADFWQDDGHAAARQAVRAALAGNVGAFEGFCATAKGTPKWWSVVVTPILDSAGEPARLMVVSRDITARQRAEAALRESEERFRALADNITQLAWMADAQGWVFWYNRRWFDYSGTTLEEMQGWGWQKVHHPEHVERVVEKVARHWQSGEVWEDTFPLRGTDGEYRWFLSRAVPICDASGKVQRWFGTNTDVTAQREATDALRQAKEQIEGASRAKDDFLAALSHELRTPLTPVLMTANALEGDPTLPLEVRDQLSMMRRNIELEARLIDDLLDLTRISRGKLTIAPAATDIHQLLQHTAEIVRSDGLGKQVRIVFILDAPRRHALADPARLQQVFWNLIKNALKFTPTGGTITVSTHNDAEGWIVVSVEDTGIGIDAAVLPHIFNAFEQGDIAGQHRYGGLGLGLAISRAIVEVHGGTIRAESEGASRGATFTVALASVDAPAAPARASAPQPSLSRALRLLIVEDHEATRTVLSRLLTRHGHHIATAGTIQTALTAFAAGCFDVVISDLGLPDGSGLDLMRELQRQRPVTGIALSGYGMDEDVRQTKEAGFFAHLVKPVNLGQLRLLLDDLAARM